MIKSEYYSKSKKEKLTARCPIIGKCERYAQTVLYLTELDIYGKGETLADKLRSSGYLSDEYETGKISVIGESFDFMKTNNTCKITNACPEVTLFDNRNIFGFIP